MTPESQRPLHPCFGHFMPQASLQDSKFFINFMGVRTARRFLNASQIGDEKRDAQTADGYPDVSEDYIEWIDVLEAVLAAQDSFTMMELGAGYGKWLVNAAAAVKQLNPNLSVHLVGVEAEPQHFAWMTEHLNTNGLDSSGHRLISAAVSDEDAKGLFRMGKPDECYAQYLVKTHPDHGIRRLLRWMYVRFLHDHATVATISLKTLLKDLQRVDLVDMDIQGAEYAAVVPAMEELKKKAKRIHIGVHSSEIRAKLKSLFLEAGWHNIFDYAPVSTSTTPWGDVRFMDGVQSWVNPSLR
ncbi:MAG: FkbM family methyltransferase [Lentisphaerae bacterium]|nr:FkbM family methyltransferase [Lentisphaerota bacterium]